MIPNTTNQPMWGATAFPRHAKLASLRRGFRRRCPSCGEGRIFKGYLRLRDSCPTCQAPVGVIRADDFPAYLTIFIVGHLIVPALVYTEVTWQPSTTFQMILWPGLAVLLSLALLPVFKGAVVGFMWSIGMKGDEQR